MIYFRRVNWRWTEARKREEGGGGQRAEPLLTRGMILRFMPLLRSGYLTAKGAE